MFRSFWWEQNNHLHYLRLTLLSIQFMYFCLKCICCMFIKVMFAFIFTQGLSKNLFASCSYTLYIMFLYLAMLKFAQILAYICIHTFTGIYALKIHLELYDYIICSCIDIFYNLYLYKLDLLVLKIRCRVLKHMIWDMTSIEKTVCISKSSIHYQYILN